jgi:hypothetical protein
MRKSNIFPVLSYVLFSIALVVFQSSRRFSLWDFANYTDLGIRIANGSLPYIDFPLYTQPGSFLEVALFTKFIGHNIYVIYLPIILKLVLLGILINLILIKILGIYSKTSILKRNLIMVGMSFLNPWFIIPQPTYDADLAFAIILSFFLVLISLELKDKVLTPRVKVTFYWIFIFGTWIPFFYKQTSGFIWLVLIHIFVIMFIQRLPKHLVTSLLIGDSLILPIFYFFQQEYNLVTYWINDTLKYPSEVRLTPSRSPLNQILQLSDYRIEFLTILIFSIIIFFSIKKKSHDLFFTTFLSTSSFYLAYYLLFSNINSERFSWDTLFALTFLIFATAVIYSIIFMKHSLTLKSLQIILLLTCIGNFLSQGLVSSSYAFWTIYIIILLISVNAINFDKLPKFKFISVPNIFAFIFTIFIASIASYSFSLTRLDFVRIDEKISHYPKLYGWIGTPGKYLEETQVGIDLFSKYSKLGKTTVWPGEDPVSLFSGFIPSTDVSTSDQTTNPSYLEIDNWLSEFDIEYIIWKTRLHLPGLHQVSIDALTPALDSYEEIEQVGVYKILKKISN